MQSSLKTASLASIGDYISYFESR
eukprot:UN10284